MPDLLSILNIEMNRPQRERRQVERLNARPVVNPRNRQNAQPQQQPQQQAQPRQRQPRRVLDLTLKQVEANKSFGRSM